MTDLSTQSAPYDPKRPWIKEERDDPDKANYGSVFFHLTGETSKPVFLRAQSLLWIGRYLAVVIGFTMATGHLWLLGPIGPSFALFEGMPVVGLSILIGLFALFSLMSCVSHVRRLHDAGRSSLWALFVPLPLVLAIFMGTGVMQSGAKITHMSPVEYKAHIESVQAAKAEKAAKAAAAKAEKSGEASADAAEKPKAPPPRGGKKEQPTADDFMLQAMETGLGIWMLSGFFAMLFTTVFVARLKPETEAGRSGRLVR